MALNQTRSGSADPTTHGGDPRPILAWFERRPAIPLSSPPRFREYGPLSDDPDYTDLKFPMSYISGAAFGVEYLDMRGWQSTRTIRCVALDPARPGFLQAYCNVRKTVRTFRLDRILSTTNLRTGVTSQSGGERVLFAPAFLPGDPTCGAFVQLIEASRPGLSVLLALAMSDGWLSLDARDVVVSYMIAEAERRRLPLPPKDLIAIWVENQSPSKEAVLQSMSALLADSDALVHLLPRILEISRTFCSASQGSEPLLELIRSIRLYFRPRPPAQTFDLIAWR